MKVVILAGGYGTRLAEYTDKRPKPLVEIGGIPILHHIMKIYARYGHKDFIVALGYKASMIKDYFLNYSIRNSDFSVDLSTGKVAMHSNKSVDWTVTLIDTGLNTMTGGRLKRIKEQIGHETFMLTYGDGLSDIDISSLLSFHQNHGKLVTVTAVRPKAKFGELSLAESQVSSFEEKPQLKGGWISGGFFVIEPDFISLISSDDTMLEREPLQQASAMGELMAYKHHGFWQCMDSKRDHDMLEALYSSSPPWGA